jgi:flavin-dependent thymidylate synthase
MESYKMKITLISTTPNAMEMLIFTKNTRLTMSPSALEEIMAWPMERKMHELEYMVNTIPSSWEFVDYTFMIEGVTRAFTHQLVRTRTANFAQQTMRVLDVSEGNGWDYLTGPSISLPTAEDFEKASGEAKVRSRVYHDTMEMISLAYRNMIRCGAKIEDARGVLPTNILTNIVMKINMRNFVELIYKRSGPRVQEEYRQVLDAMKASVLEIHPWISLFIDRTFDKAVADLDDEIMTMPTADYADGVSLEAKKIRMMKLVDQLRSKQ